MILNCYNHRLPDGVGTDGVFTEGPHFPLSIFSILALTNIQANNITTTTTTTTHTTTTTTTTTTHNNNNNDNNHSFIAPRASARREGVDASDVPPDTLPGLLRLQGRLYMYYVSLSLSLYLSLSLSIYIYTSYYMYIYIYIYIERERDVYIMCYTCFSIYA